MDGSSAEGTGVGFRRMSERISERDPFPNGSASVKSSNKTTPRPQMSVRASAVSASPICSGDMYAGEPRTVPVCVMRVNGPPCA